MTAVDFAVVPGQKTVGGISPGAWLVPLFFLTDSCGSRNGGREKMIPCHVWKFWERSIYVNANFHLPQNVNGWQVSQMYETTLSALKEEGNERMWFNTYVKLAKVTPWLSLVSPCFAAQRRRQCCCCVGGGGVVRCTTSRETTAFTCVLWSHRL